MASPAADAGSPPGDLERERLELEREKLRWQQYVDGETLRLERRKHGAIWISLLLALITLGQLGVAGLTVWSTFKKHDAELDLARRRESLERDLARATTEKQRHDTNL